MLNNINNGDLNVKLQQLQTQIDQFNKLQQTQSNQNINYKPTSSSALPIVEQPILETTYPKNYRSDTVEDILNNPQWKQELAFEFNASELGTKAKNYTEILFMEFCEKQTGRTSTTLTEIRKNQQTQDKKYSTPIKKPEDDIKK